MENENSKCISIEEFMAFVEDGWDYVIGWDGNGALEDAIYEANAFFREVGVPSPKKVYFKEGYYDAYPVVTSENNINCKYVYREASFKEKNLDDILQENMEVEEKIVVRLTC